MQPATTTTIGSCNVRANGTQAFSYIGSNQRLYLLVQQGEPGTAWQTIDLISQWQSTVNVTPPFPRVGSGPRSGPIAVNAFEAMAGFFVFYIDQNNHLQALPYPIEDTVYAPPGWPPGGSISAALYPDLTERTGAPPAASFSGVASYGWESQQSQHVVYVGEDGNVWELLLDRRAVRSNARRPVVAVEQPLCAHGLHGRGGAETQRTACRDNV